MKRITCIMLLVLGFVAVVFGPAKSTAANGDVTVTGAARATFAQGAALGSVALKTLEVGTGVFIEPDGTANGVYSAVLTGRSLLGQSQQITVDGKVLSGEVAPDGRVYFNGVATINLGNGTPSISGVPFSVSATSNSMSLAIDSTSLPAAQLVSGNISIN
jgi:hypothetical protein